MNKHTKEGLVMVITGASSGIGRATALEWARKGGSVVLAARSREVLEEVSAACVEYGGRAHIVQADVSIEEDVNKIAEEAITTFGKIDVWLNNAAVMIFGRFDEIPTEDILRLINTNLCGYIYGARAAVRRFRAQGYGTLINMASVSGIVGQPYSVPYSASKAGIHGLSKALSQELENEKYIHVCTVHPSVIDTPIYQNSGNYTGKEINPPTSASPAYKVAHAVLRLTENPKKEVFVGKLNLQMRLGRNIAPKIFDKMTQKMITAYEFRDRPAVKSSGNLYAPIPEQEAVSGGWIQMEKEGKRPTLRKTAGKVAMAAGILLGISWLLSK